MTALQPVAAGAALEQIGPVQCEQIIIASIAVEMILAVVSVQLVCCRAAENVVRLARVQRDRLERCQFQMAVGIDVARVMSVRVDEQRCVQTGSCYSKTEKTGPVSEVFRTEMLHREFSGAIAQRIHGIVAAQHERIQRVQGIAVGQLPAGTPDQLVHAERDAAACRIDKAFEIQVGPRVERR